MPFIDAPFKTETMNSLWNDYLDMRKKIKKPATEKAKELAIKKIVELSGGNKEKAVAILEQSIMNSWQGLFSVKERQNGFDKSVKLLKGGQIINVTEDQIEDYKKRGFSIRFDERVKAYYFFT